MSRRRFAITGLAATLALALACSRQSTPPTSPSSPRAANADAAAAADGSTLKATVTPVSPLNNQPMSDAPTLISTAAALKFGGTVSAFQYRFQVFNEAGGTVQDSGLLNSPSFRVTATMEFKKRHTWRVRAEVDGAVGPWSSSGSFISSEGGYLRGNQLFDPLFNGESIAQSQSCGGCGLVGPVTFLPNQGVRLETTTSYVRYRLPQTLTAGEFSVEIEGLRANAPGDKTKVFSMGSDAPDFITDPYRVDIQYRGTAGFPPNAIQFRVLYGSATDLDVRYEPDTATRLNSVVHLVATTTYFWKFTWGNGEVRLRVQEGGANDNGRVLYNIGVPTDDGSYSPQPHMIYLGAPTGRSGAESASIPGAIYRNVYVGPSPRPF